MRLLILLLSFNLLFYSYGQDDVPYFLSGHTNDVTTVAYSPDNSLIVSGSWDGYVNVYLNDSTPIYYLGLSDHTGAITDVAFSRDSKHLLTAGQDGVINSYRIELEDSTSEYKNFILDTSFLFTAKQINKVYYGPGLRMIFAGDDAETFIAFDLTKRVNRNIKVGSPVNAFAVSIDRMSYFIATKGNTEIIHYDILGKEKRRFSGHKGEILSLAVTLNRKYLISSSVDKTIKVWNLVTGEEERSFSDHTWSINAIDVDPYSKYVVSCGLDGIVNVHDIETGDLVKSFDNKIGRCQDVSFSTDLSHIIVALQLREATVDGWEYGSNIWATGLSKPDPKAVNASNPLYKRAMEKARKQ